MGYKKILVVDDDEMVRTLLEETLLQDGYDVRTAMNAEESMKILRQENIMVMFLDLVLPDMNGTKLCRQIRKENPVGIIYAFTGHIDLFNVLELREAGFDDFFSKPFRIDEVLEEARMAFEKLEKWGVFEQD
ncbi:response regulator [Thermodesulfobacteriota bacterium]